MAVELCKVSLWMEALEPGRPLSFLESHVRPGNALLGALPGLVDKGSRTMRSRPFAAMTSVSSTQRRSRGSPSSGSEIRTRGRAEVAP